jgi:hypothetical protein
MPQVRSFCELWTGKQSSSLGAAGVDRRQLAVLQTLAQGSLPFDAGCFEAVAICTEAAPAKDFQRLIARFSPLVEKTIAMTPP